MSGETAPRIGDVERLTVIYGTTAEELRGEKAKHPAKDDAQKSSFAAGVLWSIMQDAEHLADKAQTAHEQLMRSTLF